MKQEYISAVGYFAGTLTTVAFLPQVMQTWRTKSAKDISAPMFYLMVVGIFVWVIYGIFLGSAPLVIFNSISLAETAIILYVKIKHD